MTVHIPRAQFLLEHSRYKEAEQELRQAIQAQSGNPFARSLLAIALAMQKAYPDALDEARTGIRLAPNVPYSHFALAWVLYEMDRYDEAQSAVMEALRLDAQDPRHYGLLGSIHLAKREWRQALDVAETGLNYNAENVRLINLRAMALVKLGRKEEAGQAIDVALAQDPENAATHANQGWALLHRGEHKQALIHFREALRLNPDLVWAKQGIVEALKARNPIYWVMLRYFLWMSRLGSQVQWGIIIGLYVLSRLLRSAAAASPALAPWLMPILILYSAFAMLTWAARPMFDLFLRLNRFGRYALTREQIVASNWVGLCLLVALVLLVLGLIPDNGVSVSAAIVPAAMIVPVSGVFRARPGRKRWVLAAYAVLLALVGMGSVALLSRDPSLAGILLTAFAVGWMAFSWVANLLR
jgi:tetratricopeptide (TPR) repeat protein